MTKQFETIKLTKHDNGLWHILLNRPDVHNAFNAQMIAELTEAFVAANGDHACRFVLLSSCCKSFCAGADLEWMQAAAQYSEAENQRDAMALSNMLNTIDKCSKPVIAIAAGGVFGGGVGLVSVCDVVIGTKDTKLCLSEVRLGLIPATIAPFVVRAMGARQARRYFQTAEVISAENALKLGLIHQLVEADQMQHTVQKLLESLAKGSPDAQAAAKQLVHDCVDNIDDSTLEDMAKRIAKIRSTPFAKEGLQAFFDKRQPGWVVDVEEVEIEDAKISINS